ncbi:MAG: hypothetical protein ACFB10_11855, partial [Salibacteraceae bacterium]
ICVLVSWVIDGEKCEREICQKFRLEGCKGSDCKFEGELEVGFDDEKCLYQFAVGNAPANVISYNWTVSTQNTNPTIQPNASAAMIGISPLETGVHTICVTVTWTDGADTCRERLCFREELKRCTDPCEYSGEIGLAIDRETCEHKIWLQPVPNASNVSYAWTVRGPNSLPVALNGPGNQQSDSFFPQLTGTYEICVLVSWVIDGEKCEREICQKFRLAACGRPDCETNAKVSYRFDEERCLHTFSVGNAPANVIGFFWEAAGPSSSPAWSPNNSSPMVNLLASEDGVHKVCVTLTWLSGGDTCTQRICDEFEIKKCETKGCEQEWKMQRTFFEDDCLYRFDITPDPTTFPGVSFLWKVTDPAGNTVNSIAFPTQSFAAVRPVIEGNHRVCVLLTWVEDGQSCSREICCTFYLKDCSREDCAFEGNIQLEVNPDDCLHQLWVAPLPAAIGPIQYDWNVQQPDGTQLPLGNQSSQPSVAFVPNPPGGQCPVCVTLQWDTPEGRCETTLCQTIELKACEEKAEACLMEGRIAWDYQAENCEYQLNFSDADAYNNLHYSWRVIEQGGGTYGTPVELKEGPNAPEVSFAQQPGRIYRVFLILQWSEEGQSCEALLELNLRGDFCR